MKPIYLFCSSSILCTGLLFGNGALAKGKPVAVQAPEINTVTVDRVSQAILVDGSDLLDATFELGGQTVLANPAENSINHQEIDFTALADVVGVAGNYNLVVNGVSEFSIYIDGAIVDPGLSDCPCQPEWDAELSSRTWLDAGNCLEIGTQIAGNINDTDTGTILTIGAVYDATNPTGSVCSLTETNSVGFPTALISHPVNPTQQSDCATDIKSKLTCSSL